MIPADMVLVRTADLVALLNVAIARGEVLEYYEADDDYRQWLAEISATMTPPAQQVAQADGATCAHRFHAVNEANQLVCIDCGATRPAA